MFSELPVARYALLIISIISTVAAPAGAADPLRVEYVKATSSQIGVNVRLTGTLEALDSVDIGFREGGRVVEMLVSAGDEFTQGQLLARIDPLQLQQSLNASEATLESAVATENQARQAAERAQALLDRGVGTRAARDEARRALSEAEAATKQAESAQDQARRSVEDTELVAPFDGVVTARSGEPGQVVGPAQAVLSLAAAGGIEAIFLTPDIAHLGDAMGKPVALETIDVEASPMTGEITEIAPLVDAETGSVRITARVHDAPEDIALLGASVSGEMVLSTGQAVVVPWTALTSADGKPAVWVVTAESTSELREVEVERFDDGVVLLSGGVEDGETVVGSGSQLLFPGRAVANAGADS